jgi:putative hydrolase of HD superfamily
MTTSELQTIYSHITNLKVLKRAGWVRSGVKEPESVADHSFGLAVLALMFAQKQNLDVGKVAQTAILHDIGESIIGDITPHDGVNSEQKKEQEAVAVQEILEDDKLYQLWLDFEEGRTPEGRLVKQLDKLEAYLQARSYDVSNEVKDEFYKSTSGALSDPALVALLEELRSTSS